jgi:hypothetical protein
MSTKASLMMTAAKTSMMNVPMSVSTQVCDDSAMNTI